jgi:hypothetical protein
MFDDLEISLTLTRDSSNSMDFRDTYEGLNNIWCKFDVDKAGNVAVWANADGFEHLARYFLEMARSGKDDRYHAHHSLEFGKRDEPEPELTIGFIERQA